MAITTSRITTGIMNVTDILYGWISVSDYNYTSLQRPSGDHGEHICCIRVRFYLRNNLSMKRYKQSIISEYYNDNLTILVKGSR